MDADLVALGLLAIVVGIAVAVAARRLAPRLEAPEESFETLRFLTALITGILVALGLGLVLVGVLV